MQECHKACQQQLMLQLSVSRVTRIHISDATQISPATAHQTVQSRHAHQAQRNTVTDGQDGTQFSKSRHQSAWNDQHHYRQIIQYKP
jgi:hypothetical protein